MGGLAAGVRAALARVLGQAPAGARAVAGGDINQSWAVTLGDGRVIFVKTNPSAPPGMFAAEARGLAFLAEAQALRTPRVLAVGDGNEGGDQANNKNGDQTFLALEFVRTGPKSARFDEELGRGLARLHRAGAPGFGLDHDNFIGRLGQENAPCHPTTWATFYGERRLLPMMRRLVAAGLAGPPTGSLRRTFDRVVDNLDALVGPPETPARLHGDLWAGNHMTDETGHPVLVDPAAYGGHREVDLAMMRLFGGYGRAVFDAYADEYPLAPGCDQRVPLYQLYYLLAHAVMFGSSYRVNVEDALAALTPLV